MGAGKLLLIPPLVLLFLFWLFVLLPCVEIFICLSDYNFNAFWGITFTITLLFSIYRYIKGRRIGIIEWKKIVFPLWIYLLLLMLLYIFPISLWRQGDGSSVLTRHRRRQGDGSSVLKHWPTEGGVQYAPRLPFGASLTSWGISTIMIIGSLAISANKRNTSKDKRTVPLSSRDIKVKYSQS